MDDINAIFLRVELIEVRSDRQFFKAVCKEVVHDYTSCQ